MEMSALGHLMRESGVWTYAIVNLTHILGIAALFGSVLIMDLRLLGLWRHVPLGAVASAATPVAAIGFVVAATTGAGLLATKATEYVGNPFLLIKFPAIAVGLINAAALRRTPAWRARALREPSGPEGRRLATMGALSLLSWLTAIAAGRLIAYW
jgi:hypothetical protein